MQKTDTTVGKLVQMIGDGELQLPEMRRRYIWQAKRGSGRGPALCKVSAGIEHKRIIHPQQEAHLFEGRGADQ